MQEFLKTEKSTIPGNKQKKEKIFPSASVWCQSKQDRWSYRVKVNRKNVNCAFCAMFS